jgi:hypothetical protein
MVALARFKDFGENDTGPWRKVQARLEQPTRAGLNLLPTFYLPY